MGKFILLAGLVVGMMVVNQLYHDELTLDKVASMVIVEQVPIPIPAAKRNNFIRQTSGPVETEKMEEAKNLKILAFGDIMLGRYVRTLMNKNGMEYVFEGLDWPKMIEGYDVVHGNLEGPIRGEGRSGGTAMVFAFNRDVGKFIADHGFTMVSVANNHAMDAGWTGRSETLEVLKESGVGFCGHPGEAEPESVYFAKENGISFAFICFQDVTSKIDKEKAVALLKLVDPTVDYLFVSVHWGAEYQHTAGKRQTELAHAFVDAGADFIIGHHPHVVENFEIYNGVPVFYSLGNFIFDQYWAKKVQEELAIGLDFSESGIEIKLIPMKSDMSQSRLMTETEKTEWLERFIGYGNYDDSMKAMIRAGVISVE